MADQSAVVDVLDRAKEIGQAGLRFGKTVLRTLNLKREICEKHGRLPDVKAGLSSEFWVLCQSLDSIKPEDIRRLPDEFTSVREGLRQLAGVVRTWPQRTTLAECLQLGAEMQAQGNGLVEAVEAAKVFGISARWSWANDARTLPPDGMLRNSAGEAYDPQEPIESLDRLLELEAKYKALGKPFLPAVVRGSPACKHVMVQLESRAMRAGPRFSMLDRYPATPDGHVAFMEFVRDDIHFAAEAKRNQFAERYSNDTLTSMVHVELWFQARERITALPNLPGEAIEQVARVLRRELAVGTVEQIDELLTPAVRALRDAWESAQDPGPSRPMRSREAFDPPSPLRRELIAFQQAWDSIQATYRPGGPGADTDRSRAERQVSERAVELFMATFVPLAARIVGALGRDRFPADAHDPPELPDHYSYDPGRMHEALFRAWDTLEAGRLVLLWAAMAHDPTRHNRPVGYPGTVQDWAGRLRCETDENPGCCRTIGQVADWAVSAFDQLVQSALAVASGSNDAQLLDQARALGQLIASLHKYMEDQESSDSDSPPEPINPGHYVHDAVVEVELYYPSGKLPAKARIAWMDLLQVSRGKRSTVRPTQEAMDAACQLSQWAQAQLAKLNRTNREPAKPANLSKPAAKASVNARMLETIQASPEAMGWNSRKWAQYLKCSKSSVVETTTWKDLSMRRDRERAERAQDRRRRPKASDQQRD